MKKMLSGIKPTGRVTLGNYIGAIKPFVSYQDEYEMIVFVANLHSMTIYQEPKDLRKNTKLKCVDLKASPSIKKVRVNNVKKFKKNISCTKKTKIVK